MSGFFGTSDHSLDDKGRLIIPKRFLDVIKPEMESGVPFKLTAGLEGNLVLLGEPAFEAMVEQLGTDLLVGRRTRLLRRLVLGHAEAVKVDGAGRMVLPDTLRRIAGIASKEVVLSGCGHAIEVWSRDRWDQATESRGELFEFEQSVGSTASAGV